MQQSDKIRIDYFEDGRIARITLDNPPVNLTTVKILDELLEAVITVSEDDRVRVLVLLSLIHI